MTAEGCLAAAFLLLGRGALRETDPVPVPVLKYWGHKTFLYPCMKAECVIMQRHKSVRSLSKLCSTHRNIHG